MPFLFLHLVDFGFVAGRPRILYTMSSPSASAMHSTVWREEVEPDSEIILQERLRHEVSKILLQAGRKAK